MGQVVPLRSLGTQRALFLAQEWDRLLRECEGDHHKATKAHRILCEEWRRIWAAETDPPGERCNL